MADKEEAKEGTGDSEQKTEPEKQSTQTNQSDSKDERSEDKKDDSQDWRVRRPTPVGPSSNPVASLQNKKDESEA